MLGSFRPAVLEIVPLVYRYNSVWIIMISRESCGDKPCVSDGELVREARNHEAAVRAGIWASHDH